MEANFDVQPLPAGLRDRRVYSERYQQPGRSAPHDRDLPPEERGGFTRRLFHGPRSIASVVVLGVVGVLQLVWVAFVIVGTIWGVGLLF